MQQQKDDYTCSVCLGILVDPCKLDCKHVFCQSCLLDLIDFNNVSFKCPMCRVEFPSNYALVIDEQLKNIILENYPEEYQKRKLIIEESQKMLPNEIKIKVKYGNFHKLDEDEDEDHNDDDNDDESDDKKNNHQWTIHTQLDYTRQQDKIALKNLDLNDLIKNVRYTLDETFFPDEVTVRKAPFVLMRWGWDVFTIPIRIKFKKEYKIDPIEFEHHLVFQGDGIEKCQIVKIDISNTPQYLDLKKQEQPIQIQQQ